MQNFKKSYWKNEALLGKVGMYVTSLNKILHMQTSFQIFLERSNGKDNLQKIGQQIIIKVLAWLMRDEEKVASF